VAFLIAFGASLVLAFFLKGDAGNPPRLGGYAVLVGILAGVFWGHGMAAFFTLRIFWFGLAVVFAVGAVDDLVKLGPLSKFAGQSVAALLFLALVSPDTWGGDLPATLGWLAFPVWYLWIVGTTNSLNLLDNMDGLTPGVSVVAGLGFVWLGQGADWVLIPLAGAMIGVLCCNLPPARIYLGDGGSHLAGFSLAILPLYGMDPKRWWVPLLVLAVPLTDTVFVSVTRILHGVSPFQGGRDHLSHRLNRTGVPEMWVSVICGAVTLLLVLLAGLLMQLPAKG
jgi:UDP-GlcNAc:undecaprenyl-phosphate GlcNAc-1-phosphate transferase